MADILEVEVGELLEIKPTNQFNQTNNENTTGYQQQIENLYQGDKDKTEKIIQLYVARIQDKDRLIAQLEKLVG